MTTTDRRALSFGAIAGGTGLILQVAMGHLHPHHQQLNNTIAAFTEYSHAAAASTDHSGTAPGPWRAPRQ